MCVQSGAGTAKRDAKAAQLEGTADGSRGALDNKRKAKVRNALT